MLYATQIHYHKQQKQLELTLSDQTRLQFSAEFLRVYSPSIEVRGHQPEQQVLVCNQQQVAIEQIEPVGNYGIRLTFSDQHSTGIYSWQYLQQLASQHTELWQQYTNRLKAANGYRQPLIKIKQT